MSLTLDELSLLKKEVKERDEEIDLLNAFVNKNPRLSSPCVIVHGYKSIGKTFTVTKFLKALGLKFSTVNCDECVSKKILLRRCFDRIRIDSGRQIGPINTRSDLAKYGNTGDSFSTFLSALELFADEFGYRDDHHVLLLDRFDQCFEYVNDLLAGFTRLKESSSLQNFTVIVVVAGEDPKEIVTLSNPHVYFKVYNETQIISILQQNRLCKFDDTLDNSPESIEFYNQYVKAIVDMFYSYTGSDMSLLIDFTKRLWDPFIEPIRQGRLQITEFVKCLKEGMHLFTDEDVVSNSGVIEFKTLQWEQQMSHGGHVQDLPLHSKFFLLASYLASYGNQRNDLHKYSKVKVVKYKKRQSTKSAKVTKGHMSKESIDTRLLSANFVDLERILAILSVIYRNYAPSLNHSDKDELLYMDDRIIENEEKKESERSRFTLTRNIDLSNQIATLFSLGLLSKTNSSDILTAKVRWKCNIDWDTAEGIAKSVNFPIAEFMIED
ncbi:origin recognition complex subunit, putative [Candida dubliniensis CD36]|uniref:Origin recognition complex subunit, putative n=1 Tax=Candida dubliniensis (strain CD36 / ATCC MYA-646 / CBS 7987 / NCPF 3949 / NRRL Y-17841) TaxID=573826 RepID=B9WM97_CANDC|nr:origin recognition complex subunit, putative [Candida dubliniensis CD36]CAX40210.1 origin recognition complex subunit, putative [Candida dubliniensis CD36]